MLSGVWYFLIFAVLLPGELLWWGFSLDGILSDYSLARRLQLSLLAELPKGVFLILGIIALWCMIRAFIELSRKSHAADPLLFGGFPLYMFSLLMYFDKPCAMAVEMPLIVLGAVAVWHTYRPEGRPAFLLPGKERAGILCRMWAALPLCGVLTGALIVFQDGVNLWWYSTWWSRYLIFLPLLGLLLRTQDAIRDYVCNSVWALILCSVVSDFGAILLSISQIDSLALSLAEYDISVACIFLVLELALAARSLLPEFRNSSLLILLPCFGISILIVPILGSPQIITCAVYVLYMLIDNRTTFYAYLLRQVRRIPTLRFDLSREFAALSWGGAALLAVWLAGSDYSLQILAGIVVVFAGSMLRIYFLNNTGSDHIILRNFPYAIEFFLLVMTAIACSQMKDGKPLGDEDARTRLMIVVSSFAVATCLMQSVWNGGGLIGKYIAKPLPSLFLLCFGNVVICFLLVLLCCSQAPASFLLGYFLLLSGLLRIWAASGGPDARNLELSIGWILVAVGQFIFVSSSTAELSIPVWSGFAAIAGVYAFVAYYVTRLFAFYCRKRKETAK